MMSLNASELHRVARSGKVDGLLDGLVQHEWMVYTRHGLNQAANVVDYLACYTHQVAFCYKNYRDHSQLKTQWLDG
jgi:hypothetical protein